LTKSSADVLAKKLYGFVYHNRSREQARYLDGLGFVDWIDGGYPDDPHPAAIAASAFTSTVVPSNGDGFMLVLAAILGFMKAEGFCVKPSQLIKLKELMLEREIDSAAVERAIHEAFVR
jgi:hypothetical protein